MAIYSNRINVIATSRSIPSLQLMITNTQNVSTPAGLQVLATVPLTFGNYSVDFDKIAFYYHGNPVYSWVESVSNGSMNVWLKMPVSIPANTSITINAMPNNKTVFDNNYWGCAPTLTNQYGQYDNGTNVFNNYWNFAGTSLPSGLSTLLNGGTVTVNNGVTLTPGQAETDVYSNTTITTPAVVETYAKSANNADAAVFFSKTDITSTPSSGAAIYNGYAGGYVAGTLPKLFKFVNGSYTALVSGSGYSYPKIISLYWGGNGNEYVTFNYANSLKSNDTTFSVGSYLVGLATYNHGTSPYSSYYWLRTRAYPPNGVMPSVTVSY